jgi:hypothetical protein
MNAKIIRLAVALALALGVLPGCSANSPTGGGGGGGGDDPAGKADCGRQDACEGATARSALAQLRLDRFFQVGDEWTVAWVYRNDDSSHRDNVQQLGNATFQDAVLVSYRVIETGTARYGSVDRRIATVAVTADQDALEQVAQLEGNPDLSALVQRPFDTVDSRIDYTVNELFNPHAKTFYAVDAQGLTQTTTVDLDGRSNLTMQFDSLPNGYPNIDRIEPADRCAPEFHQNLRNPDARPHTACWDVPPQIPTALRDIANEVGVDLTTSGVHFGPTDAQPDFMFWQPGNVHPTYIEGPRGHGLLLSQTLAP